MFKKFKRSALSLLVLALIGQFIFLIFSGKYTTPYFEGKIYATIGIKFDGNDLSKLNEGAHYFGQTMIGWTKFPNFRENLIKFAELPENSDFNMRSQERQNFIFTIYTDKPIELEQLKNIKEFLQSQLDEYNSKTNTKFVLTNIDYENVETTRSYAFGALTTLVLSIAAGLAILFIKKEFFPPKLKL